MRKSTASTKRKSTASTKSEAIIVVENFLIFNHGKNWKNHIEEEDLYLFSVEIDEEFYEIEDYGLNPYDFYFDSRYDYLTCQNHILKLLIHEAKNKES